jgi:hypothetical protein
VTGAPAFEAWAMVIGIDLGFVTLEAPQLVGRGREAAQANRLLDAVRRDVPHLDPCLSPPLFIDR